MEESSRRALTLRTENPAMTQVTSLLQPGAVAPDFEVQDHLGSKVRLADLIGKRVLLWFYPKADTPG